MELSNYARIFKALANEQRLKIFLMIYEQCKGTEKAEFDVSSEKTCCPGFRALDKAFTMVCGCTNLSRSTISHHFKELQNAGLISCERDGQIFRCKINEPAVALIKDFLR